jgi:hypothetical protein
VLTRCFGAGVLVGATLAALWTAINSAILGHLNSELAYGLQSVTLVVWPTSIFMMPIGHATGIPGALLLLALSLFFNGFLYTIVGYLVIRLFHLVPDNGRSAD